MTGAEGDVRLVVPDSAQPISRPASILSAIEYATRWELREEAQKSTLFVVPTAGAQWNPDGLAVGTDARLSASMDASSGMNPWVHEYVHTQQRRTVITPTTRWFDEGTAQYYGALVGLQRGKTDATEFRSLLSRGSTYDSVVLADSQTWETTAADYRKGALVAAELDIRIRNATGGNATFADVMRHWSRSKTFAAEDFFSTVESLSGPDVRAFAERYTQTNATPPLRSPETYQEVLGESISDQPGAKENGSNETSVPSFEAERSETTETHATDKQKTASMHQLSEADGAGFVPELAVLSVIVILAGYRVTDLYQS